MDRIAETGRVCLNSTTAFEHKPVSIKEAMKLPEATATGDKEWGKLKNWPVWDFKKVEPKNISNIPVCERGRHRNGGEERKLEISKCNLKPQRRHSMYRRPLSPKAVVRSRTGTIPSGGDDRPSSCRCKKEVACKTTNSMITRTVRYAEQEQESSLVQPRRESRIFPRSEPHS